LQVGQEASTDHDAGVAATANLRFNGLWDDVSTFVFPEENTGYISGKDRNYISQYLAEMAMEGEATFEQLPYWLEAGLQTVSPTTDSGSGYIRTYLMPTTAQNTIKNMTIEAGDDQACEKSAYCYLNNFTLSGKYGEAWQLSGKWTGSQVIVTDSFTPSTDITVTAVEEMLFQKSKLYIDVDSDTIGTTQKSNTFLDASLAVTTGWVHQHTGDGSLKYSLLKCAVPEVLLDITFEHDGTATAEKTAWRAKTARQIRILIQGSALTSAGTYAVKTCIIDLAGKWEKFEVLGDVNGNDVCKGRFRARYNANAALFAKFLIVNELATLP
jgi:hypothetical protein